MKKFISIALSIILCMSFSVLCVGAEAPDIEQKIEYLRNIGTPDSVICIMSDSRIESLYNEFTQTNDIVEFGEYSEVSGISESQARGQIPTNQLYMYVYTYIYTSNNNISSVNVYFQWNWLTEPMIEKKMLFH